MCECLCQFSLLTCCCCPPSHRATASSVPTPQFVFRIIIKFYFRHSIWEMSSVYDGFLTSLVIEYVRLFSSSPLGLFSCSPVRLLLCFLILLLLFFGCLAADNFDVFSILRFSCLLLRLSRGNFCAGVAANSPKVLVRTPPRIEVFTFSFSSLFSGVFCFYRLTVLTVPITFILIWLLCFRICRKPAEIYVYLMQLWVAPEAPVDR